MIRKLLVIMCASACLLALAAIPAAYAQQVPGVSNSANPNPTLVSMLTKQLNVTPEQATGGTGAIFGLVKSRLEPAQFSKLSASVPGMDGFLKAAPALNGGSSLGSLSSMLPGGAGGLASIAGSFKSLGLSPAMASKFVPVLQNYIQSKGGSGVANMFAGALK